MPLYEYSCKKCGFQGELLTTMGETRTSCPECGGNSLGKHFSGFSIGPGKKQSCADSGSCGSGRCDGGSCPFSG